MLLKSNESEMTPTVLGLIRIRGFLENFTINNLQMTQLKLLKVRLSPILSDICIGLGNSAM